MKKVKTIVLHILGFLLIYYTGIIPGINPYIAPILLFLCLLIADIFTTPKGSTWNYFDKKTISSVKTGIIIASIYYAIVYLINNQETTIYGTRIIQSLIFVVYLTTVILFIKKIDRYYATEEEKLLFIFRIAAIQGIICILMFLIPNLKTIAESIFLSGTEKFSSDSYILTTRIYGISNSYTYGLPILNGMLSGICLYYGLSNDKKALKYVPLIFTVSLLNGRTGIIVGILSMIIAILSTLLDRSKNKLRTIAIIAIAIPALILTILFLKNYSPNIYKFINVIVIEAKSFFIGGELTGTSKYLLESRIFFPEGIGLLFGTGSRVYGNLATTTAASDIGYVNDMFMGGLIYVTILYSSYFRLIKSSFKNKKHLKVIMMIIIISLLLANLKGEVFKNSTFMIGLFFILLSLSAHTTINTKEATNNKERLYE